MFDAYLPFRTTLYQSKKIKKILSEYRPPQAWLLRYLVGKALDIFDSEDMKLQMEKDGLQVKRGA